MQAGTHTDKHANSGIRPHGVDIPWYYVMKNAPGNQSFGEQLQPLYLLPPSLLAELLTTHLCECELCGLAKQDLLMTGRIGMVLVLFKPLDQWDCSLWGQLVPW